MADRAAKKAEEYPAHEIEPKWREWWEKIGLYKAPRVPGKKYYVLEMFPYPSGSSLHMGHLKNYFIGDVVARVKLMEGYDVLHPMGWDAFGLPAENAAIKTGVHPKVSVENNIKNFKETLKIAGISYDWDRELATCDPDYYRWTQWIFLKLYEKGLAYRADAYVNYCPNCKTVLANEQVIDGKCERCHTPVIKKKLTQWFFKITDYADRLLEDLKKLEGKWPELVIKQQENWIGKSYGTTIVFKLEDGTDFPVFTTRADTVFGVTFMTIAPEHDLVEKLIEGSPNKEEIQQYVQSALLKTEVERTSAEREKTGVFTGKYAIHPFTGERIPIWVGDYVLAAYGTGIVMGVPAHDQRDFEFAKKYGLDIKVVIKPVDGPEPDPKTMTEAFEDYGIMVNSGEFTGMTSEEGIKAIQKALEEKGLGGKTVTYRIRDWLISRQRYWGTPIPVVHCPKCGVVPVPEEQLPVKLPENIKDFKPKGRSPLEDVPEFINTTCPKCGGPARRDPDTMDTFVDSSWYFLRFIDPKNDKEIFEKEVEDKWMPVDQYIGGIEHATKHLIYARFIQKVLYDMGYTSHDEPFEYLFTQGLVLKNFYWCPKCLAVVPDDEVYERDGKFYHKHGDEEHEVEQRLEMMSKSRGNIVPAKPFIEEYGSDVARITILFAAPAEKSMEWTDAGVEGARRFINRVWRLYMKHIGDLSTEPPKVDPEKLSKDEKELYVTLQKTIFEVRRDSNEFHFNTAIARIMELVNELYGFQNTQSDVFKLALHQLVLLLAPFTPHMAEELWHRMGNEDSIFRARFPQYDERYLVSDEVEIPVQVNGRVRGRIKVARDADEETVLEAAKSEPNVARHIKDREIKKVIYIKGKLLNIVVK